MSVADSIKFWVAQDGCDSTPSQEITSDGSATRPAYSGGRDGAKVTLWMIQGGGHE